MNFVAIDFETANATRASACSIGLTIVENNEIVKTSHYYIKPEPLYFAPFNTQLHGITENEVLNAPTFDELWKDIEPLLSNKLIVAHNAAFDISVLRRTFELYDIIPPDIEFLCTHKLAQSAFPNCGSYRLNNISRLLDIKLEHHNAASDAEACAKILCTLAKTNNLNTIEDVELFYNISRGCLTSDFEYDTCKCYKAVTKTTSKGRCAKDFIDFQSDYIDEDFNGKNFVFTGSLSSMSRSKAYEIVATGGGMPQDRITKSTNYLVVGLQDYRKLNGNMSSKMKKAYDYNEKGQNIHIIVEDEFISMIDDALYIKCGLSNECYNNTNLEEQKEMNANVFLSYIRTHLTESYHLNNADNIVKFNQSIAKDAVAEVDGSITFYGTPILNLKQKRNGEIQVTISDKYKDDIDKLSYSTTASAPHNLRIAVSSAEDISKLNNVFIAAFENLTNKDIGCCSKYLECSDNKKCVQPLAEIYLHCAYRRNLLNGKIFYGKNKTI